VIGPVNIAMLPAQVLLTELLPLMQPRAGGHSYDVAPPRIAGVMAEDGSPTPVLRVTFRNEAHLRSFVKETVVQTRTLGQDYSTSILAKRVSRPIIAHVVEIAFSDGSAPFRVLTVRDGITRVVSSWATIYPGLSPAELADQMVKDLLSKGTSRAADVTETIERARGRESVATTLRSRFAAGTIGEAPTEDAVRIGQAFTLPATIAVSMDVFGTSPVAPSQQFEETIQAVIASIHGEFRPWDVSATQAAAIQRALARSVHSGDFDDDVADLALGVLGEDDLPALFEDKRIPKTSLWRAVYLLSWFTLPYEFDAIKRDLRAVTGAGAIRNKAYVAHLSTLIDAPWRAHKAHTLSQARRAWQNGGPVPDALLGHDWTPVPTKDFTTLVPKAVKGDVNARATLQVAGGVALIADKLLLSNTGSAVESDTVPFRADVDIVISGLGNSERGLYLLAHAANSFDPSRKALNSFTPKELLALSEDQRADAYSVFKPDPENPAEFEVDKTGQPVLLSQYDIVYTSNPARADTAIRDRDRERRKRQGKETDSEKAGRLRSEFAENLEHALKDARMLVALANSNGAVGHAFGAAQEWRSLNKTFRDLQKVWLRNEPDDLDEDQDHDEAGE
jgi:hypothetical protein